MHQKIEHAIHQAREARHCADAAMNTQARNEWLRVAALWDELIISYKEIQRVRDSATVDDILGRRAEREHSLGN